MIWPDAVAIPIALLGEDLTLSALRLWIALARFVRADLICWPSNETLLELMPPGMNERTLRRAKEELQEKRLIVVAPRFESNGRQTSDRYQLIVPGGRGAYRPEGRGAYAPSSEGGVQGTPRTQKKEVGKLRSETAEPSLHRPRTMTDEEIDELLKKTVLSEEE